MAEQAEAVGEVRTAEFPRPYTARELSQLSRRVMSEAEIRAATRRAENPLPCISSGTRRPSIRIYADVFKAFLLYEQGVAEYDEVDAAARRSLMGARQ